MNITPKQMDEAKRLGYSVMVIVNGEYYGY
jgi:hypothetical protein